MTRSETTHQCVLAIADYYEVRADAMLKGPVKGTRINNAKAMLTHHLHGSGMTLEAIAKLLSITTLAAIKLESRGQQAASNHREILEALPRLNN
jgi:hypothetical protein